MKTRDVVRRANARILRGSRPKLRSILFGVSALVVGMTSLLGNAVAQELHQESAERHGESTIAYRLADGKTMHFDDPQKASQHLQAVQKLGCEIAQSDHAGHGDVSYRCPRWRSLTVASDELAHQWEEWLVGAGFETLHGHPEDHGDEDGHAEAHAHEHGGEEHEEIVYRLAQWVTLQLRDQAEAQELVAITRGLGCEVREANQGNAVTISIRCAQRMHVECPSHEAAEFWQQWLAKTGFEAVHED